MEPTSMDNYEYLHEVNTKSVIKLIRLAEPHLEKRKGTIVNVSSVASSKAILYYSMAKAALDHYMRSRTQELARKGIRINNLNPGFIRTNAFAASGMTPAQEEEFLRGMESKIPLGRIGTSEEMAKTIAFLASDDASYVTGVAMTADGGLLQQAL
uniref:SDR family oxidoreductase n=1 Tax=Steinernema glaseri TaxID=37863 RepID=A0A1I7Z5W3_9BILA